MKETRFSDFMIGIFCFAIGVVVFFLSSQLQTVKLGIGPSGFPKFISVLLCILGLVMCVKTAIHGIPKPHVTLEKKPVLLFLASVACCVLYIILLPTIGFILLTPILMFCMLMLFGNRKYVFCVIISIVTTALVWLLFTKVFLIFLPACRLFT